MGCEKKENEQLSSVIITNNGEIMSAYQGNEDVSEKYIEKQHNIKEKVAEFLNRECSSLEFDNYCMLEQDGVTIDVKIQQKVYTIIFDKNEEIMSIKRIKIF